MQSFFVQKKTIIIEAAILIAFLAGIYYVYTSFSEESATVSQTSINEQLLGQNFTLFLKVINQDKVSFNNTSFMKSSLVEQLRDFSEVIGENATRGRADPFAPYASSRPLR